MQRPKGETMSTRETSTDRQDPMKGGGPVFARKNKVGFVVAILLGLSDLPAVSFSTPQGQVGPPPAVLLLSTICGIVTLVAVLYGWIRHSWPAIRVAAGARVVSMLAAMPGLFVDGLPGPLRVVVAASVLVTIATVTLMLMPARRTEAEWAR
ncbi:MAG: hypothetical protein ABJA74_02010 [Lapillicoccus sp.]